MSITRAFGKSIANSTPALDYKFRVGAVKHKKIRNKSEFMLILREVIWHVT